MAAKILHANLNHVRQAQNLFCHTLDERGIGLAIAAEPYKVPARDPNWVGDECGSMAIVKAAANSPSLSAIERGVGYAAAKWEPTIIVGCYAPPPPVGMSPSLRNSSRG